MIEADVVSRLYATNCVKFSVNKRYAHVYEWGMTKEELKHFLFNKNRAILMP